MNIDPTHAKLAAEFSHKGTLYACGLDEAGKRLLGAGSDGAVYAVDLSVPLPPPAPEKPPEGAEKPKTPEATKLWSHHGNYVSTLLVHENVVITGGYDRRLVWTDAASGQLIREVEAHAGWIRDAAWFPDRTRFATVGDDMLVKIWETATGKTLAEFAGHTRQTPQGFATALYAVAVSPDGKTIASGDRIGDVFLWDMDGNKQSGRFQAPGFYTYDAIKRSRSIGGIRSLALSADSRRLAIGGIGQVTNVDGFVGPCRVEVWDWQAGKRLAESQDSHQAVLNSLAFHPSGDWLIAGGGGDGGGLIGFWSIEPLALKHKAKPKGHLQDFFISPDGTLLYAVGHGGFQIWRLTPPNI